MAATADDLEFYYPSKDIGSDGAAITAIHLSAGSTQLNLISAELTEANDYWNDAIGWFVTGSLAGEYFHVKDFDAATDKCILFRALSATPSAGDTFRLVAGGRFRSASQVPSMDYTNPVNCSGGVTVNRAGFYNSAGAGTLTFSQGDTTFLWAAPGDTNGTAVDVSSSGTYTIYSSDQSKWINITVNPPLLPGGAVASDTITLTHPEAEVIPHFQGSELASGRVRYHLIVAYNANAADDMTNMTAFLDDGLNTDGLKIGLDAAGASDVFENPGTVTSAPAGVTFSAAVGSTNGLLIGTLSAQAPTGVWVRESAAAGATPSADILSAVKFQFDAA